ncbi:MmcQ/YjbR family DNA-binding protein [Halomonas caseinilytica]|uniref:MmcQ/YjbR family DNA-binding protein n=1 Tax=Halomonas caseinilytica TaxID=438744 RepID=UPI000B2BE954|nr:MmcQ/YjbR family DNA-binding protein [Halomonas caseinilytica]
MEKRRPGNVATQEVGVTYDEYNDVCRSLPATTYVMQWGGSHVWKVGGKVFAIGGWEKLDMPAFTFKVSELDFEVLRDQPGFRPAPYLASRGLKWIQLYDGRQCPNDELSHYLSESHHLVTMGLSKRYRRELGLE